uniref:Uncharacterized protein n=1 Tax=Oryza punctata TaxID=4537 RepID=A0A0E0JIG7_ORYPU
MYRGSCRARAWSEPACGMFLLGWGAVAVMGADSGAPLGWANRNNEKGEKDVKVLMGASPVTVDARVM